MTCREMTNFLADYIAGELPHEVVATFESHVDECGDCGVYLSQYRTTISAGAEAFKDAVKEPLPEALVAAILASIDRTE